MKKKLFIFFFPIFLLLLSALHVQDIPQVMQRMLDQHIDTKSITTTTVQRWFKLYIEQFDPDKSYLLEQEALPYLNLSENQKTQILQKIQKKDFSDFSNLNQLIQKAIVRAQNTRKQLKPLFIQNQLSIKKEKNLFFAKSEQELLPRQAQRLYLFFSTQKKRASIDTEEQKNRLFSLFEKKLHRFEKSYLSEEENPFALHILKSFAKSLDAHTAFFSEEEASEMRKSLEKQFEGIGVILVESIHGAIISEIIPKSPAHESGKIHPQDLIVEIDGKWVKDWTFEEVLEAMKRKEHENITLGLCCLHEQNEWQENMPISRVTVTSKALSLDQDRISFSYERVEGGILAKITLYSFYENKNGINSEKDMRNAFQELEKNGKILGVILDLRNNAGGFLHQAVKVSGLFISNGIVVISKYGSTEKHYLRVVGNAPCFTGPCIVLTSKLSASAAEIVAQALQDYGVALVVGDERTFGKGTIQYQTVTQNKADAYFKVTVGRYYTVSGKSTQIDGVVADIVVPSEYAAYNFGERFLEYPLPADHIQSAYKDSLEDLEEPAKTWFQKFYLPKQQKKVTLYQKMVPALKQNSLYRQTHDPQFKQYLEQHKNLSLEAKKKNLQEDLQMQETINILKDMIILESQQKAS